MKQEFKFLHQQFLKKNKRTKWFVHFVQIFLLIGLLALWQVASMKNWIDPLLFSSPIRILDLMKQYFMDGTIYQHMYVTVLETIIAFVLSTILGTLIAIMLWWSSILSRILDPYLVVLNAMPKVAIGPIVIVIFGPNISSSVAMGVLICIIVTILVIYDRFRSTDENYMKVLQTFGANKCQIFYQCIFPSSLPTIISTLKVNVGLAWVGVIVGEFLVSKSGLGYLIVYGFQVFDFTLVLSSTLLILIFAAAMYFIVERIEFYLLKARKAV